MNKIFGLIFIATALSFQGGLALANTDSGNGRLTRDEKINAQWEYLAKSWLKTMPDQIQNSYDSLLNDRRWETRSRPKFVSSDSCFNMRERTKNARESATRSRFLEMIVYKECLNNREEIRKSFEVVMFTRWIRNAKRDFRSQLFSNFYKNSFFLMSEDFGLNIERNIEEIAAQLIAITFRLKDTNVNFQTRHPDVKFLVERIFSDSNPDIQKIEKEYTGIRSRDLVVPKARVKAIMEASEAWFIRYHMIKNAKKSVRVQSYSLFDDLYGRAFVGLLLEAIERGVEVKLMLDGRGSILTSRSDLVELLARRGAQVASYNPMLLSSFNIRKYFQAGFIDGVLSANHDKLLIVDDNRVLTGGRNIGDRYFIHVGEGEGRIYRDMEVYAETDGKSLESILAFNIEFYSANAIDVTDFFTSKNKYAQVMLALKTLEAKMLKGNLTSAMTTEYPQILNINSIEKFENFDPTPNEQTVPVTGLDKTSALVDESALTEAIFSQVQNSEKEIFIMNPYVILTDRMRAHLIAAANRGVLISIITTSPTSTDSLLTQARLIDEWKTLFREIKTLRLYGAVGPEQMHAKAFVFDRKVTMIGSYNLDQLSERNNSEFSLMVESPEFAEEVQNFMEEYAANQSLEYSLEKNIGPANVPGGTKKYKKMRRLMWFTDIVRPWL